MSNDGIIIALLSLVSAALIALFAWIRFLRKDRADANSVEEGTISARFKDADALMRYIDDRVDERTAAMSAELDAVRDTLSTVKRESHEVYDSLRAFWWACWVWDQKGRPGPLPTLDPVTLERLGIKDPFEDTQPVRPKETP
ncbi:hypothetical protein F6X37_32410 [Paraburkholderia sp. 31.1]|uniref:hypothetical protein n=1 Tax=Paraburkholderia sp. 31.1 TaxID=2615205 RepID=UPI0016560C96|nr:hypothetical protein [Paraburkholderia sp. 31.1]MBC8726072.1 hypothetical protein [Paraburkholderia sp. 31.1]